MYKGVSFCRKTGEAVVKWLGLRLLIVLCTTGATQTQTAAKQTAKEALWLLFWELLPTVSWLKHAPDRSSFSPQTSD